MESIRRNLKRAREAEPMSREQYSAEVISGIQALRYEIEKLEIDVEYFDSVLCEARLAVLLNEQNDPYAKP